MDNPLILLVMKNWKIKIRHKAVFFFEMAFPIILACSGIYMRSESDAIEKIEHHQKSFDFGN